MRIKEALRGVATRLRTHSEQVREPRVLKEGWLGASGPQTECGYTAKTVSPQLVV